MMEMWPLSFLIFGLQGPVSATHENPELALAAEVVHWARETGDVDAMLVAVDLLQAGTGSALVDAVGGSDVDANALLEEATGLARGASEVARVAAKRATLPRGIARALGGRGPIGQLVQVSPVRPLAFSLTARGGEQALLHIGPTGGGELEVSIVDETGKVFCRERAPGRPVLCNWRPAVTTTYRVNIRVVSPVAVTTVITSN